MLCNLCIVKLLILAAQYFTILSYLKNIKFSQYHRVLTACNLTLRWAKDKKNIAIYMVYQHSLLFTLLTQP